jgi:localization factor PodJL
MASEASWQTSSAGDGNTAFSTYQPMHQRTVESLLRRLVERVEESEWRYGEALDELHARLDRLSQTTEAARETSAPEDSDTFNQLHTQVSKLARRLGQDTSTPLDDFERLGQALTGGLRHDLEETPAEPFGHEPEPSPFAQVAIAGKAPAEPVPNAELEAFPDFGYTAPERVRSKFDVRPAEAEDKADIIASEHVDLDKWLVAMAERLEQSIGTAMPTGAIEALNTRLDEIGGQLTQALEKAPMRDALDHVERQISDMSQQVNRAEEQLCKIGGIEAHLLKMIERLDEKPAPAETAPAQLVEIANKAATEAASRVAAEAKQSSERLDAMHRDLNAMSEKNRESSDRLVSTLEAVHESLKQLVQQVERGAPALQQGARAPFLDRARQAEAKQAAPQARSAMPSMAKAAEQTMAKPAVPLQAKAPEEAPARERTQRDRLGAAIPDFKESETPPLFGRGKRQVPGEEAVDLDATQPRRNGEAAAPQHARARVSPETEDEHAAPDDLVAAARRAAQAAAMRAEERGGRRSSKHLPSSALIGEQPRSRRSVLIFAAAVLLICSAILLYGRLASKPETETAPAATEESTPAPSDATDGTAAPKSEGAAPAGDPEKSGWAPLPGHRLPPENVGQTSTGFTDIAKSSVPMPASELAPEPQLAALKANAEAALPPGVVFSIEEPAETGAMNAAEGLAGPAKRPLPPKSLGALALREARAKGGPGAQ